MARVRRLIVSAFIGILSFLPTHPSLRHADWTSAERGWARGPVWYIMTNKEYRDFRHLRSDRDRGAFIHGFWDKRDPIPDTSDNELEQEFWRRVDVADSHFGQDIKPGWKTQRGKVFIMLGPPDNFDHDQILADKYAASRWLYDLGAMPASLRAVLQESLGVPAGRRFVKLTVRAENVGTRAVDNALPLESSVLRPTDFLPLAESLVRRDPSPDALRSLGQLMRVPEVMERNRTHVDVTTVFSLVPVHARIDFRPAPLAVGRTDVAVTLGVQRSDLRKAGVVAEKPEGIILTGYLTSVADESRAVPLSGAFLPAPSEPGSEAPALVFQALSSVTPGRYLLDVSYQDTAQRIMGSVRDLIDVPPFEPRGLNVSSLMLANSLEKIEGASVDETKDSPFMLGRYRVVPRTSQVYDAAESLLVFYQVNGSVPDAAGQSHLDLSYQFYIEDAGAWLAVGPPIEMADQPDREQGWSVPLAGMPPGRYRLEAMVTDRATQTSAIRGTLFEIAPSAGD